MSVSNLSNLPVLGEEPDSFGFGGTGRFSTNCKFDIYGETFGKGDVIAAMIDFEKRPPSLSYSKNGRWLGVPKTLQRWQVGSRSKALFPHILAKNVK